MKHINKCYNFNCTSMLFFTKKNPNIVLSFRSNKIYVLEKNNFIVINTVNFKNASSAIEHDTNDKVYIKGTLGNIIVYDYKNNYFKKIKNKMNEGYCSFKSENDKYICFFDWTDNLLIINTIDDKEKMINFRNEFNITTCSQAVTPYKYDYFNMKKCDCLVNGESIINNEFKTYYYNIESNILNEFKYNDLYINNSMQFYKTPFEIYFQNNFCFIIYLRTWNSLERYLNVLNHKKELICQLEFDATSRNFFMFFEYTSTLYFIPLSGYIITLFDFEKEAFVKIYKSNALISACFYDFQNKEIYLRFIFAPHCTITIDDFDDISEKDLLMLKINKT